MGSILLISKISFIESVRDKIFIGLLCFMAIFFAFSIYISSLSLGETARYIGNTGMLAISIVCLTVTVLFGLFSIYREKERNELYVIISRMPRSSYLLGRFLGTAYIIILFSVCAGIIVFLLTWLLGKSLMPMLLWASYWAILEFTLLSAIGLLFYCLEINFTLNAILLLVVYLLGHSLTEAIQSFIGLGQLAVSYHLELVRFISYVVPNFDMFDFRLAIIHGDILPSGQIVTATLYWCFYLAAVLALGSFIMNKKDI